MKGQILKTCPTGFVDGDHLLVWPVSKFCTLLITNELGSRTYRKVVSIDKSGMTVFEVSRIFPAINSNIGVQFERFLPVEARGCWALFIAGREHGAPGFGGAVSSAYTLTMFAPRAAVASNLY
jgi:hypothetical protein